MPAAPPTWDCIRGVKFAIQDTGPPANTSIAFSELAYGTISSLGTWQRWTGWTGIQPETRLLAAMAASSALYSFDEGSAILSESMPAIWCVPEAPWMREVISAAECSLSRVQSRTSPFTTLSVK